MKLFIGLIVAGTLAMASTSFAQLNDGFESYAVGTLPPQGGWTDFGGSQPVTVSTVQAHSGTKSMRLSEGTDTGGGTTTGYGSDVYKNFLPAGTISTGQYTFSYWQYIEPTVDSIAFMYISSGRMPTVFGTGLDLRSNSANTGNAAGSSMLVVQDIGGVPTLVAAPAAIVTGRWAQHSMSIDLSANTYSYSYDGTTMVAAGQWDTTPGDGVTLGGFDFWMQLGNANGINNFVYYDDFLLTQVPAPSSMALVLLSGTMLSRRRRR